MRKLISTAAFSVPDAETGSDANTAPDSREVRTRIRLSSRAVRRLTSDFAFIWITSWIYIIVTLYLYPALRFFVEFRQVNINVLCRVCGLMVIDFTSTREVRRAESLKKRLMRFFSLISLLSFILFEYYGYGLEMVIVVGEGGI